MDECKDQTSVLEKMFKGKQWPEIDEKLIELNKYLLETRGDVFKQVIYFFVRVGDFVDLEDENVVKRLRRRYQVFVKTVKRRDLVNKYPLNRLLVEIESRLDIKDAGLLWAMVKQTLQDQIKDPINIETTYKSGQTEVIDLSLMFKWKNTYMNIYNALSKKTSPSELANLIKDVEKLNQKEMKLLDEVLGGKRSVDALKNGNLRRVIELFNAYLSPTRDTLSPAVINKKSKAPPKRNRNMRKMEGNVA